MDGGSTDGTIDWLNLASERDGRIKFWSAADSGAAAAINSGFRRAQGVYVGWLNADDLYTPGAISRAMARLQAADEPIMVYGNGFHIDSNGDRLRRYPTLPPPVVIHEFLNGCFICQPTVFFRRSLLFTTGLLDESLKTAFDFDYWLRVFKGHRARIGFVPQVQALSRWHADTLSARLRSTVAYEALALLRRHLDRAPLHWALTYLVELTESAIVDTESVKQFSEMIARVVSLEDYDEYRSVLRRYSESYVWARAALEACRVNSPGR